MYYFIAQLIGFVAMTLCIGCFQFKSSRVLLLVQLAGNAIYIVHYLMLGAFSGCISMLIVSLSNTMLCVKGKTWSKWKGWKWVFSAAFVAACILTWQNAFSLLPCAASVVLILTNWSYNGKVIRLGKLAFVGPAWIIYNIVVRSYSGILCEMIGMCSSLISIHRYGLEALDQKG